MTTHTYGLFGVPTGGVPRREDGAPGADRAMSEKLRHDYMDAKERKDDRMDAKEREDDRTESEAFAARVPKYETIKPDSALDKQVAGDHYKKMKIQPVEFIHANNIPFIEGCIIKYAARWRDKGGVKDLEKIIHFAQLLIELETKK